jgi:GNAT superfamily N-acetyltransferase
MINKIRYFTVYGNQVPKTVQELTLKERGVMHGWYKYKRGDMRAVLAYNPLGILVGWAAVIKIDSFLWIFDRNTVAISVFVSPGWRKHGIGSHLLERIGRICSIEYKHHKIRYGASRDFKFFNDNFAKVMVQFDLKGVKFYD